jgi:hypothetical protein
MPKHTLYSDFKALLLLYLKEDELNKMYNKAADKIQRLYYLTKKYTHVIDKLAAILEDIFHLISKATLSVFNKELYKKQLKKHL